MLPKNIPFWYNLVVVVSLDITIWDQILETNVKSLENSIKEGGLCGELDHPTDSIIHYVNLFSDDSGQDKYLNYVNKN